MAAEVRPRRAATYSSVNWQWLYAPSFSHNWTSLGY